MKIGYPQIQWPNGPINGGQVLEGPRPAKVLYANSRVAKSCGKAAVLERGYLHATWLVSTPAEQGRE